MHDQAFNKGDLLTFTLEWAQEIDIIAGVNGDTPLVFIGNVIFNYDYSNRVAANLVS